MSTPLNTIYSWFETGDFPTQAQFQATFSSFFHRDENIPVSKVEGLTEMFQSTVSSETLELHFEDEEAHAATLAKRNAGNIEPEHAALWKEKLGITNIATIDSAPEAGDGNVFDKEQIAGFFGTVSQLQTEYGNMIADINQALLSNDLNLDELQEIVNYIKENRADIDALEALVIGETTEDKVNLLDNYSGFGLDVPNQRRLNIEVLTLIGNLQNTSMIQTIAGSGIIPHTFQTDKLMIQARDSVTGKEINCENFATSSNVQINFLDDVPNPVHVLILKIA